MSGIKFLLYGFSLLFNIIIFACQNENITSFKGCCDTNVVEDSFGNATIYIANIFTPNGDGLNDYLVVHGDSLERIISVEVKDRKENMVIQQSDVPYSNGIIWDGKINGTVQRGLYSVYIILQATDGTIGAFETEVCNYPCGLPEGGDKISMEGCRFSSEWKCWLFDDGCLNHEFPDCFK